MHKGSEYSKGLDAAIRKQAGLLWAAKRAMTMDLNANIRHEDGMYWAEVEEATRLLLVGRDHI